VRETPHVRGTGMDVGVGVPVDVRDTNFPSRAQQELHDADGPGGTAFRLIKLALLIALRVSEGLDRSYTGRRSVLNVAKSESKQPLVARRTQSVRRR
jgi:hypothetical protein